MGAKHWEKILEFVRWRGGKKVCSEQRKQCFLKHGSQKECGLFSSLLILLELREFVGKRKEMKLPWVWSGEVWQEELGFIEVNWELLKGLEESERILFALKKNRSGNSEEGQECIRIDPQGTPTCMRETEPRGRRRGEAKEFKGNPRASGFVDEKESVLRNKKTQECPMPQRGQERPE